jgi:16S rRNA (cytidine1402-2'-O)-methyltransferase
MPGPTASRRSAGKSGRGTLHVVATPIGNLGDLSERARQTLAAVDLIAAEDTRHTLQLLQACGVSRPLLSLHEHNEAQRIPELLGRLAAGEHIALVSDAGTPLLSDPGFELVSAAARAGHEVRAVPGPSAITAALAVAGIPTARFSFEGFLPARRSERRARLTALADESRTLVFFEAPHRLADALADLSAGLGAQRSGVIARELTKTHEQVYRGTLAELAARARSDPDLSRGEITLIVSGATPGERSVDEPLLRRCLELLGRELPPSRAAAIAAQLSGASREEAYALLMRLRDADDP